MAARPRICKTQCAEVGITIGRLVFGPLRLEDAAGAAFHLGRMYCALADSNTDCADTFLLLAARVALETIAPQRGGQRKVCDPDAPTAIV